MQKRKKLRTLGKSKSTESEDEEEEEEGENLIRYIIFFDPFLIYDIYGYYELIMVLRAPKYLY